MKVLIVNTSDRAGGAAVAALRLCEALNNNGVKASMLVRDKQTVSMYVCETRPTIVPKWHFLVERLRIFWHLRFKRQHLFDIDTASNGSDITSHPAFRDADVVHLHWVNQGMLSLRGIRKILASGKPVVWTMHDAWPATAICHLTLGCRRFTSSCSNCKYLPDGGSDSDLAARVWSRKQQLLQQNAITFVACSRWLAGEAKASALLKGQTVTSIPNPIDTRVFTPGDRLKERQDLNIPDDFHVIIFVAQRVTNPNKGMDYLVEACKKLAAREPQMVEKTRLIVVGSHSDEVAAKMPFATMAPGSFADEKWIARLYRAADVFVLPSLSENLPNTIMEAMACGTPCVGFRVGGIPEEIDHKKNGYVATYRDSDDLAEGMHWILFDADWQQLSAEAARKVSRNYSQTSVAIRYSEVYQQALAQKHFKL